MEREGPQSSDTIVGIGEEDREAAISGEGEMPTEKVGHTRVEDGVTGERRES